MRLCSSWMSGRSASLAIPSTRSPIRWDLASPIALVTRQEPIVLAVHQGRGDHEVGRGPVAGNGDVPPHRHSQQCLHVGIVRKGLEWIPEEDQEVDPPIHNSGANLLIAAQGATLELGDLDLKLALEDLPGRARRKDLVVRQQIAVKPCPFDQIPLLVVVGHQSDLLVAIHRDSLVGHTPKSSFHATSSGTTECTPGCCCPDRRNRPSFLPLQSPRGRGEWSRQSLLGARPLAPYRRSVSPGEGK